MRVGRRWWAVLGVVAVVTAGCTGDDDVAPAASTTSPATAPAARPGSPFCEGIAQIGTVLDADPPPDDVDAYLVDAYQDLLPVAPTELAPAIEALIANFSQPTPAATAAAGTEATAPPDDQAPPVIVVTAGERVAEYVAEHCGRIDANPGPAATPPLGGYDTVADTAPATSTVTSTAD